MPDTPARTGPPETTAISGTMSTTRPERYAKQLLSHWSARGQVTERPDGVLIQHRDNGQSVTLRPAEESLSIEVAGPDDPDLQRLADAVKVHLERFGQRDELGVIWNAR